MQCPEEVLRELLEEWGATLAEIHKGGGQITREC